MWCVVVVNSYQHMKGWNHISKIWCGCEYFFLPELFVLMKSSTLNVDDRLLALWYRPAASTLLLCQPVEPAITCRKEA